jgi:hypothetical protein
MLLWRSKVNVCEWVIDSRILPYRPPKSLAPEAFEDNKIFRNGQIKNRV